MAKVTWAAMPARGIKPIGSDSPACCQMRSPIPAAGSLGSYNEINQLSQIGLTDSVSYMLSSRRSVSSLSPHPLESL